MPPLGTGTRLSVSQIRRLRGHRTILSPQKVRTMRRRALARPTYPELAEMFGVSKATVRNALLGLKEQYRNVLDPGPLGGRAMGAKPALSPDKVREMRRKREAQASYDALSSEYRVSPITVPNALLGLGA